MASPSSTSCLNSVRLVGAWYSVSVSAAARVRAFRKEHSTRAFKGKRECKDREGRGGEGKGRGQAEGKSWGKAEDKALGKGKAGST